MCVRDIILGLLITMHRYTGELRYSTHNSGRFGQPVYLDVTVSFFPGRFSVRLGDINAETTHSLQNRRFNYQSRDSPVDLLARDKWKSWWFDRFTGTIDSQCPRVGGVPDSLKIALICSWDPAFAIIEFQLNDTHYQLSCRPPRGVSNWARQQFTQAPSGLNDLIDDAANHEPASSSHQIEPEPPAPV